MTFDQIQSFYMVATLGTFRQAAEQLNASQPTISARIAALEDHLRAQLFDRSGHRVALTPQGRLFLTYAETLLEIRAEAMSMVGGTEDLIGVIRIGAADTMSITWIPDFFSYLRTSFPNAVFELHVGPSYRLRDELLARQLDVAFVVGPIPDADIANEALCACPMVLAAAPELALHDRPLSRDDVAKLNIFTFERQTRPYQDLHQRLNELSRRPVRLNPVNSLQTVVLLVEKGLGVGAVPLAAIDEKLKAGTLVLLRSEIKLPDILFSVSYPVGPDMLVATTLCAQAMDFLKARQYGPSIRLIY